MIHQNSYAEISVEFYDETGEPLAVSDASITLLGPAGSAVSLSTTQRGAFNVYTATHLFEDTGLYMWRGVTSDPLAASGGFTAWQTVRVVSSAEAPTLSDIVTALRVQGVTFYGPEQSNGHMVVVAGDDYHRLDGRAFTWQVDDFTPDLTGSSIHWYGAGLVRPCVLDDGVIYLDLPSTDTMSMEVDKYSFAIRALLGSGSLVTIVQGSLTVTDALGGSC